MPWSSSKPRRGLLGDLEQQVSSFGGTRHPGSASPGNARPGTALRQRTLVRSRFVAPAAGTCSVARASARRPSTGKRSGTSDPEMLLMAPVGMHLPAAKRAFARTQLPEFWHDMEAVLRGRVFVVEPVYFERPGPRIVDGVACCPDLRLRRLRQHLATGQLDAGDGVGREMAAGGNPEGVNWR